MIRYNENIKLFKIKIHVLKINYVKKINLDCVLMTLANINSNNNYHYSEIC